MATRQRPDFRFTQLLIVILLLILGYPYFRDDAVGVFFGGMTSLVLGCAGVYAVHTTRWQFLTATSLALLSAGTLTVFDFYQGVRGHPLVEFSFFLFYGFTTVAIFLEVIYADDVRRDTVSGAVCVYLLLGLTFGTLYDFMETMAPGSFHDNVAAVEGTVLGFRQLLYFSYMTLTTVGYGDITPVTSQAQSIVAIEGVVGVLYVAVLIARIVGIYSSRSGSST